MALSDLYYFVPDALGQALPTGADAKAPAHGVAAMKNSYIATAAFQGWAGAPSTFVALSSASDSVGVMLGAHPSTLITAPYMISAILIKRRMA